MFQIKMHVQKKSAVRTYAHFCNGLHHHKFDVKPVNGAPNFVPDVWAKPIPCDKKCTEWVEFAHGQITPQIAARLELIKVPDGSLLVQPTVEYQDGVGRRTYQVLYPGQWMPKQLLGTKHHLYNNQVVYLTVTRPVGSRGGLRSVFVEVANVRGKVVEGYTSHHDRKAAEKNPSLYDGNGFTTQRLHF